MKRLVIHRHRGGGLCDLIVVLVLVPLLTVGYLGCLHRETVDSTSMKCASNLRQIGQAIQLYMNENQGAYPRTRYDPATVASPTWGTGAPTTQPFAPDGPQPNDVTAALFLLLRTQDITSEVFTCPSSNTDRWDFGGGNNTALNWSNWNGTQGIQKHLSYSYENPYPTDAAVKSGWKLDPATSADYAVAADINPGMNTTNTGSSSAQNVLQVTPHSSAQQLRGANSPNHDRDGQNVLYGDGHVSFEQNVFVGVKGDNIYTSQSGAIVDAPQSVEDSVLLPTMP
jgi:prepilin-type processing-associated H-X9-DG protein